MLKALIGHTGFVGGNLASQVAFDTTYNSTNIEDIRGRAYELVVCAGAPGAKWKANKDPDADRASIERLMSCLASVSADHAVLISTVDVYPEPINVNEETAIEPIQQDQGSPYGRHRLQLERFVSERFESTIVRLPALFGPGLKKNAIYDILHDHQPERICPDSVFQFYPAVRLWSDIELVRSRKLRLVNFATEPTSMSLVAKQAFGRELSSPTATTPVTYDMRTKYSSVFGKSGHYLYDKNDVLASLRTYLASQGWVRR